MFVPVCDFEVPFGQCGVIFIYIATHEKLEDFFYDAQCAPCDITLFKLHIITKNKWIAPTHTHTHTFEPRPV